MKKTLIGLIAAASVFLAGCESRTDFGPCVGVGDNHDSHLVYKVSTTNLVVGVIFFETIIVPIVIANDEFYCPVSKVAGAQ